MANSGDYKPGSLGCHELLDRTSLLIGMIESHLLSHPSCIQNREWYAMADEAMFKLNQLYQSIGSVHLGHPRVRSLNCVRHHVPQT